MSATERNALRLVEAAPSELERARTHVANAEAKMSAANAAVDSVAAEISQLEQELLAAFADEKSASERDDPTAAKYSARIAELTGTIRRKNHRASKLRTEAEMCRVEWVDLQQSLARLELQDAHRVLGEKADKFTASLAVAAADKAAYYSAVAGVKLARVSVDGLASTHDFDQGHVGEILLAHVTCELLQTELFSGKDYTGRPIRSAADVVRDFGQSMPLVR